MKLSRIRVGLLLLILVLGIVLLKQGIFRRPDRSVLFRQAAALEKTGHCRQALPILKKLVENRDDFPEKNSAALVLARCYTRLEDWPRAISWWKEIAKLPSPRYQDEACFNQGKIAEIEGKRDLARSFREDHARRFPRSRRAPAVRLSLARMKKDSGDLKGVRNDYLTILENFPRQAEAAAARQELGAINMAQLYSPRREENGLEYTVRPGDTLAAIAAVYHTTPELLQEINGIKGEIIRIDQKIKVPAGRFRVLVSKTDNTVSVYLMDKLFKIYPAGTGQGGSSPVGTFTIVTKLIDPPWFHDGLKIPPGDPANILGSRWMGFPDPYADYGIHGTTKPETIGTQCSAGCVRMHNKDVEELFKLLPRGTKVTIK